jgi:hypothetical protein
LLPAKRLHILQNNATANLRQQQQNPAINVIENANAALAARQRQQIRRPAGDQAQGIQYTSFSLLLIMTKNEIMYLLNNKQF